MKTRIFIGSSSEGLAIAKYVQSQLENDFNVYLWTDDIFKANKSFLETLVHEASLFDFGVLIATKDDLTKSRKGEFETPRDNVIFEFGLFLGRLGLSKSFLLQEKEAKLPSDLMGITIARFEKTTVLKESDSLNREIENLRKTIKEKIQLGELGLLPSTSLAISYYYSFLEPAVISIYKDGIPGMPDVKPNNISFKVILPRDLDGEIKKRKIVFNSKNNLSEVSLPTDSRDFPIHVLKSDSGENVNIYDMPTILNGLDKAIELYMRKGYIGKTEAQAILEERELRNFEITLQNLINNDAYCKEIVEIVYD